MKPSWLLMAVAVAIVLMTGWMLPQVRTSEGERRNVENTEVIDEDLRTWRSSIPEEFQSRHVRPLVWPYSDISDYSVGGSSLHDSWSDRNVPCIWYHFDSVLHVRGMWLNEATRSKISENPGSGKTVSGKVEAAREVKF